VEAIEIQRLLRERPFRPFEVQLSTGEHFPVAHPDMLLVTKRTSYLGIKHLDTDTVADDIAVIANVHVVKLERLRTRKNGSGLSPRRKQGG